MVRSWRPCSHSTRLFCYWPVLCQAAGTRSSITAGRIARPPVTMPSGFSGFRFPPQVILLAGRGYLRYRLSYRDLEELLAERGIEVDHVTLYRWVQRFTPLLIEAVRLARHLVSDRWFVRRDLRQRLRGLVLCVPGGGPTRAGDRCVRVSHRRDIASARSFFTAALAVHGDPGEVITHRAPALANVIEELVLAAWHNTGQYENNDHGRAQGQTQTHAEPEDASDGEHSDPRSRLHPERPPRPLRVCSRRHAGVPAGCRVRRTHPSHLISTRHRSRLGMACDRTTQQGPARQ